MRISRRYTGYVFVIALSLAFCAASVPVAALDRSNGDYWTYEMTVDLEGMGDVIGEMTLTVVDEDSLTIDGNSYEVDVLEYSGSVAASGEIMGVSYSISMVYAGFTYELKDSLATVKDDMLIWSNATVSGQSGLTLSTQTEEITTTTPPLGTGLVPGEMGTGDSWSETVKESSTSLTISGGETTDSDSETTNKTYSFMIASATESLETTAGTFDCLKITITDESSESREIRWYCDDVGYYVKIAYYDSIDDTASVTVELKEYSYSPGSEIMMILLFVAGAVVLFVIVAVVAMKMKKKSPQQPMPPPPPAPPVQ